MAGLNRVMLIGNLTKDPETRTLQSGKDICKFTLATNTGKDRQADFHRIVAFDKLAGICGQYLSKGSQVYIEGRIKYGSYEKDGQTVYTTDIIAGQMVMLGGKGPQLEDRQVADSGSEMGDDVPF